MSKTKSDKIPHYELLYLVSNKYSENELEPVKEKVLKAIAAGKGIVTYDEFMGKRRLAYAIKGFRYGYYQVLEFDLEGAAMAKLDKDLKLDHEILRHQIIRKVAKDPEVLKKEAEARHRRQEVAAAEIASAIAQTKEAVKAETEKKEALVVNTTKKIAEETPTPKKSKLAEETTLESQEELDSKLDKILGSDILYK
ncbi:30S ribosomal protein S6 [Candidatus Falkowbacteria bacterium]|nr:30S ribosomal protein S6 [Candidatus Falkowbacteria bacterium]